MRLTIASLALISGLCGAPSARAEIIRCVYTEPFVNTAFDTRTKSVTMTRAGTKGADRFRVTTRRSGAAFVLTSGARGFRQVVTKDGKGSDGMSDTVFPYSATLTEKSLPYSLSGGCR